MSANCLVYDTDIIEAFLNILFGLLVFNSVSFQSRFTHLTSVLIAVVSV